MKELLNGEFVPDRIYYYLLDYNDHNKEVMLIMFPEKRLADLTKIEFYALFRRASSNDFARQ